MGGARHTGCGTGGHHSLERGDPQRERAEYWACAGGTGGCCAGHCSGDQEVHGRVVAESPVAVVQQGDTTYTLMIELKATDLTLRPGMNARMEILTE